MYFIQGLVIDIEINGKPNTHQIGKLEVYARRGELIFDIPKSQVMTTSKTCILKCKQQITKDNYLILLEVTDELSKTSKYYLFDTYLWRQTELGNRKYYKLKEFEQGYEGFNKLATKYFEKETEILDVEPTSCFEFDRMED
ncbi:hypothetical protein P9X10_01120 [Bacillus cereus]|nr:hypothetical protein [Bacillus cereus]